ncbi:MAG: methyl-accepting chemotaxis protein [Planctomycetota bacterium]
MWKQLTVGRRIKLGFALMGGLLAAVAALAAVGLTTLSNGTRQSVATNDLAAELSQREIDHLNWAGKVSELFTDDSVTTLDVQTDPHKCGFGQWYYGDRRRHAEELCPDVRSAMEQIEQHHTRLHESVKEIAAHYNQADESVSRFLREKKVDHLQWMHHVKNALLAGDQELQVQTDPTRCSLGRWLTSRETVQLAEEDPAFAEALEDLGGPHEALHRSAVEVERLLTAGQPDEAARHFAEQTEPRAHECLAAVDGVIARHDARIEGQHQAKQVFDAQTRPSLAQVQRLLEEARQEVTQQAATANEDMLRQAAAMRMAVLIGAVCAGMAGIALAVVITRGISRALQRVVDGLAAASEQTASAAGQVSATSQSLAEGASEQAASLQETSASVEQSASMAKQNAANATEAQNLAHNAKGNTDRGAEAMERMSGAINDIKASSDETAKIIKTIDEIAFQTNLLALNAAVEAARAGEAGKGFAVVAEEVRNLAQRSADAARNTSALIEAAVQKADHGVAISDEVAAVLRDIAEGNSKASDLVSEIAAASNEQAQGIDQINTAVGQMDQVTQSTAANAEESASAAEELSAQAEELQHMVRELERVVYGGQASHSSDSGFQTDRKVKRPATADRPAQPSRAAEFRAAEQQQAQQANSEETLSGF